MQTTTSDLGDALRSIKDYVGQLLELVDTIPGRPDDSPDNQTIRRLVLNARDSLQSAVKCAQRDSNHLPSSDGLETGVNEYTRTKRADIAREFDTDLEEDLSHVTPDFFEEPDWSDEEGQTTPELSVNVSVGRDDKIPSPSDTSISITVGGLSVSTPAKHDTAAAEGQVDEFADIDFDDDFSNDSSAEQPGKTSKSDVAMAQKEADFSAELMEDVDFDSDATEPDTGNYSDAEDVDDDPENQPQDPSFSRVLKKYFGYSKFRPLQWKIINSVLNEKKDNCVIMATGYGKSLCYQFPSVYTQRLTVVISPLISLMEDQVLGLKAANIPACLMGTAQADNSTVRTNLLRNEYRLLYITPEFASSADSLLKQLHSNIGIDLIAIDEAHCVSQWGHDFRSAYRTLGTLKELLHQVPVMALTATATVEVRRDIIRSLKLQSPTVTCTGFDRPNLYLSVSAKSTPALDLKRQMTKNGSSYQFSSPTIIYCPTKKITMEVTAVLKDLGVLCLPYHAGLSFSARKAAHDKFVKDQIQVVVATVAFGMGIDKPDVRKVIHYGAPKDIESYYQEVGRAGRDGMQSYCHVFYSDGDFNVSRHFINEIRSEKFRQHKTLMMHKMQQYLATTMCRRRMLLNHFEGRDCLDVGGTDNCCDNCSKRLQSSRRQDYENKAGWQTADSLVPQDQPVDLGQEVLQLFSAIEVTGNRFGLSIPIQFLVGSHSQKLQKFHSFTRHNLFGSGKQRTQKFWKALAKCLMFEGFLRERAVERGFGATVEVTKKAYDWMEEARLKNKPAMKLVPSQDLLSELRVTAVREALKTSGSSRPQIHGVGSRAMAATTATSASSSAGAATSRSTCPEPEVDPHTAKLQVELYMKLVKQRNEISLETGFTPHSIASNKVLLSLARIRPSASSSLDKIEDLPAAKAERFGQQFVHTIVEFCQKHDLPVDQFPKLVNSSQDVSAQMQAELSRLTDTQRTSYVMFVIEKKSLEEVASLRGLKTSTIASHLCDAIKTGLAVDIRRLGVSPAIEDLVISTIKSPPINYEIYSLTRIKDRLPSYVEYNHIKAVIASLVAQLGQTTNPEGNLVLGCKPPENTLSAATIYKIDDDDDDNDVRAVPAPHSDPSRSPSPDLLGQGAGTVPAMLQKSKTCPAGSGLSQFTYHSTLSKSDSSPVIRKNSSDAVKKEALSGDTHQLSTSNYINSSAGIGRQGAPYSGTSPLSTTRNSYRSSANVKQEASHGATKLEPSHPSPARSSQDSKRPLPSWMSAGGKGGSQTQLHPGSNSNMSTSEGSKRKVPEWMTSSGSKRGGSAVSVSKKIKSNSLFR